MVPVGKHHLQWRGIESGLARSGKTCRDPLYPPNDHAGEKTIRSNEILFDFMGGKVVPMTLHVLLMYEE